MSQIKLEKIQHGLETAGSGVPSDGTLVAATFQHMGEGSVEILDRVVVPNYARGVFGPIVEDAFVAETGTRLTLDDAPCALEDLIWHLCAAIKALPGAASAFAHALPTTAANSIRAYTWEYRTAQQEYEFGYGCFTDYAIHADADDEGGTFFRNGKVEGRKSVASTVTPSLGKIPLREVMNLRQCTWKIDALGTAAGTASAQGNALKGFSWELKTGWMPEAFAVGRSDKDFADFMFHNFELKTKLKVLLNAVAVTRISNARAATGEIFQVAWAGSSSRAALFNMPVINDNLITVGNANKDGLRMAELEFSVGYSETTTAQGAAVNLTASASTTVT